MRLVTETTARDYLIERGLLSVDEPATVEPLSGGVSNVVLLVRPTKSGRDPFVLKQAREQLRTPLPWFCPVERMLREIDVLRACAQLVEPLRIEAGSDGGGGAVGVRTPSILAEDRPNFAVAMTAAPVPHATWKEHLLAGRIDVDFADACGRLLGTIHARSWNDPEIARQFADRRFFDDLRIDPYYRQIARVHADLEPAVGRLIESLASHPRCLVHGDFSPKNLLVWDRQLMLIDFEVGHFGDPAFDLGFFLSHLVLKSFFYVPSTDLGLRMLECTRRFWRRYRATLSEVVDESEQESLERRAIGNFAGCLLARVDGKSRVDYLPDPQPVRRLGRSLLFDPPGDWETATSRVMAAANDA